jgi:4'-phosphopantetheinyl transferase
MDHLRSPNASTRPDRPVRIGPRDVHLWYVHLDWAAADTKRVERWLSLDERQRAQRFRFDRDRNRFIVRRAVLRMLLGEYLESPAGDIAFVYRALGKPALAPAFDRHRLSFNASHSHDLAVVAVAFDRTLGVDVEWVRPLVDLEAIARRFFAPRENLALNRVAPAERVQAFFNCWTRKEAFVKASGEGLTRALDSFEVSLTPGEPARLLHCADVAERDAMTLRAFVPAPGYVGAIAATGCDWTLRCYEWQREPD